MVDLDRLEEIRGLTLNSTFDRVKDPVTLSPRQLGNLMDALSGISTLNRVIIANEIAEESEEDVLLASSIIGGFKAAISALAGLSLEALETVIEQQEKKGEYHAQ